MGIALFGTMVTGLVVLINLNTQTERRANERMDRLEDDMKGRSDLLQAEMNRRFDRVEDNAKELKADMDRRFELAQTEMNRRFELAQAEMNRRFDEQDGRIRGIEQSQAFMSGQFSELKDYFTHDSSGD